MPEASSPLSPLDSVIWRLDAQPALRAAFATVSFLDRAPDLERLRRRMAWAVAELPHFTQRVVPSRVPGLGPMWETDPEFSVDRHVRRVILPDGPNGVVTDAAVLAEAARLVAAPFDPDRPLWEFTVITGLEGGRAALLHRMHHALTDGEGGIRLSERYLDVDADTPHPSEESAPDPFPGGPPDDGTPFERAVLVASERVGDAVRGTASVGRWALDGIGDPARFPAAGMAAVDAARSLSRQVVLDGAKSSLWRQRSDERALLSATVPFDTIRDLAHATSTSVNDVFVTAVVRAAGTVHRAAGRPVDELRVAVPVSVRKEDGHAGGNAFAPTRVLVPTGGGLTAGAHLRLVSTRLSGIKSERSNTLLPSLSAGAALVPTPLLAEAMRRQAATIDIVTSNLRAAPFPLFVGGAHIEATYPLGPLMGTPVNVTMMTYEGRADLGVHVDTVAIPNAAEFRDRIVDAVAELQGAA